MKHINTVIFNIFILAWIGTKKTQQTTPSTISTTTTLTSTTPIPNYFIGPKNITWNPQSTQQVIFETDEGYKIAATITTCKLDSENNEYATISTDDADETILIAYNVSNSPSIFYNTHKLYGSFVGTSASNLTINFGRVGDLITTTTTEVTTTTFLPTPSVNDTYECIVHLSGIDANEYKNPQILTAFREMIANMALAYCEQENFALVDPITINNVQIIKLQRCTNGWPTCNPCAEVRFAVPLYTNESSNSWKGYQLNAEHLIIMWNRYANDFLTNGITTCVQPNTKSWIKWQIVLISVTTGFVLVLLLLFRYYSISYAKKVGKSKRQTATISTFEDLDKSTNLKAHYLQETPALFDNAYPMYKPEIGVTNSGFEVFEDNLEENNQTNDYSDESDC